MVIPYLIIKATDTHLETVLFKPFFSQINFSKVPQYYIIVHNVQFLAFSILFVGVGAVCWILRHFNRRLTYAITIYVEE
jgi:hypothetical protein